MLCHAVFSGAQYQDRINLTASIWLMLYGLDIIFVICFTADIDPVPHTRGQDKSPSSETGGPEVGALNSQHGLFKSIFSILCLKFEISRAFVAEMEQMYYSGCPRRV